jgi:YbbR domain-containing protein
LQSYIQDFLLNSTQLIAFKPETFQINYSPLEKKEVPVTIAGKISAATGYIFTDSLTINPSKVWIYGNKKTLDTIRFISTTTVKEEHIQKNPDLTLQLKIPKGVRLSTEKVNVTGDVEEYTEKKFELPVVCYNLPENIHIRFFPSTVEVICPIALNKYSRVTANDLEISIDYQELSLNPGQNVSLVLTRKPQWLINYRIVPDAVEYLIEQKRSL